METISLDADKQKKLCKRVKAIKKNIKSGEIKIQSKPQRKPQEKKKIHKNVGGLIYLGHIPHGFYENEMTAYFNQFGKVLAAVVARSKKTGRSKGYGFVKFADEDVAKIAAETMNNYLMFNRVVKCRYIPPEERKGKMFIWTNEPISHKRKINRKIDAKRKNTAVSKLSSKEYRSKAEKKINEFKKFFANQNIDFTFMMDESNSNESKSEGKPDDQLGVLEIDESDNEIQFKTPPQVKKIFKKSINSPDGRSLTKLSKVRKSEVNNQGKSSVKQKHIGSLKISKLTSSKVPVELPQNHIEKEKVKSQGVRKKLEKKDKSRKKSSLTKSLKPNKKQSAKTKSLEKGAAAALGQKKIIGSGSSKTVSLGRLRRKKSD